MSFWEMARPFELMSAMGRKMPPVANGRNGWIADIALRTYQALIAAMSEQSFHIAPRDKPGLLAAMMREFAGDACISFEGDLHRIDWTGISAIEEVETSLRRQTSDPILDFVILPLTPETRPLIWEAVSKVDHLADDGIIHTQIEKDGRLAFGAYDNFHPDCVWAGHAVPRSLLQGLKESGVIRSFDAAEA